MSQAFSTLVEEAIRYAQIEFSPEDGWVTVADLLDSRRRFRRESTEAIETLVAVLTNDAPSVSLLLDCVLSGTQVVSVPAPERGISSADYASMVLQILATAECSFVVARRDIAELCTRHGVPSLVSDELAIRYRPSRHRQGFSLVQFSSGTQGVAHGVKLTDEQIGENVMAMAERCGPVRGDSIVSWLPLSHDMGLIGCLFAGLAFSALVGGTRVSILDVERFLRRPKMWMERTSHLGASFVVAPDFGYRLATRYATAGLDLSCVRVAIVGAEFVRPSTLLDFEATFGPSGFSRFAFTPAYGMAEVGLGATMVPSELRWRCSRTDGPVSSGPALVGSGVRLSSTEFDGLGRIEIKSPSLGSDFDSGKPLAGADGWFRTGDLGILDEDGWLSVCGRIDAVIVVNGRNVGVESMESAIGREVGVREGRVLLYSDPRGGYSIAAEHAGRGAPVPGAVCGTIRGEAMRLIGTGPVQIRLLRRGSLPTTGSGKVKRAEAVALLVSGQLDDRGLVDSV